MSDLRARLAEQHPDIEIWAAGGIILRDGDNAPEVLLIHRPHRGDWSFPKGKLDDGETLGQAALREVREETGFACRRRERLPVVRYVDARGRRKLVVYWTMQIDDGAFVVNDEVDAIGWFDLESAAHVLTYERDVGMLGAVAPDDSPLRMLA